LTNDVSGYFLSDEDDKVAMRHIFDQFGYAADPHGAIGYAAIKDFQVDNPDYIGVYLETAHPAKFLKVMEEVLPASIEIPHRLEMLATREKKADLLPADFKAVKYWLLNRESI